MSDYIPPEFLGGGFHCPLCGAHSQQHWGEATPSTTIVSWATCNLCKGVSVWVNGAMSYPSTSTAPLPHPDMPEELRGVYEEARGVLPTSARAASALLRLSIDQLVNYLDADGASLFDKIGDLKMKGMPEGIAKALDVVRVSGNSAVHPGQIDINDTSEMAHKLFKLINVIIENQITTPSEIEAIYNETISAGQQEAIERRDQASSSQE